MPVYEYNCKKCGEISEFLVGIQKQEELKCKTCGYSDLEKIFSRSAVREGRSDKSSCAPGEACANFSKCCKGHNCGGH
jgi:putative FmdB family regulatory protein